MIKWLMRLKEKVAYEFSFQSCDWCDWCDKNSRFCGCYECPDCGGFKAPDDECYECALHKPFAEDDELIDEAHAMNGAFDLAASIDQGNPSSKSGGRL